MRWLQKLLARCVVEQGTQMEYIALAVAGSAS